MSCYRRDLCLLKRKKIKSTYVPKSTASLIFSRDLTTIVRFLLNLFFFFINSDEINEGYLHGVRASFPAQVVEAAGAEVTGSARRGTLASARVARQAGRPEGAACANK
ncbi:jg9009 [Pararge aegeria aegeria]|uniref:Jg9009 protein n=1 Tax=Pararge aegeria aegeria TaxID=348720 RepID=A0A8S4R0D6_9NEOP|nr:jg9009 [Pararge aegeria aegeria]